MKKRSDNEVTSKLERKTVEKNRRMHMKSLFFKLSSLIHEETNIHKDGLTQEDLLEHATIYIKKLRGKIEDLKRRKERPGETIKSGIKKASSSAMGSRLPMVDIKDLGSTLEVTMICGASERFVFYRVMEVLEEEGAEVNNASFCTVGDKSFYTNHSRITIPRIGLELGRVSERLEKLVRQT